MAVKVSPKFQVVIPEAVLTSLAIKAGSKVVIIARGKVACLVPVLALRTLQNSLKGKLDRSPLRDKASPP